MTAICPHEINLGLDYRKPADEDRFSKNGQGPGEQESLSQLSKNQLDLCISGVRKMYGDFCRIFKLEAIIPWDRVERALRARPDLMLGIYKMGENDGVVSILQETDSAFFLADCNSVVPRRGFVYDLAARELLQQYHPHRIVPESTVMDIVSRWGVRLMNEQGYSTLHGIIGSALDATTSCWLETDNNTRLHGLARQGDCISGLRMRTVPASQPDANVGFRCMVEFPKVD